MRSTLRPDIAYFNHSFVQDPYFKDKMKVHVYDIIRSRNMHKHMPSCFKYGHKRCRARFPRRLVPATTFNEDTGIVDIQRNDAWLNGYNPTLAIMTRANHDVQFLSTKNHALAVMYYVNKYMSKPEASTHSKLTIAAAVRKSLSEQMFTDDVDIAKKVLHKTYNKLDSHREVGMPEALSHLLNLPDHLTAATFENIHTSHLLHHLDRSSNRAAANVTEDNAHFDSTVIHSPISGFSIVSPFDDYAHRGQPLVSFCLYDYRSLVYKKKKKGGIPFSSNHPQYEHYRQFVRRDIAAIPNLLGRLLFVQPTSDDEAQRCEYYCLVSGLFLPWSWEHPLNPEDLPWDVFFDANKSSIPQRLLRHIDNLTLLHKSKEETQIDLLHQQLQDEEHDNHDLWEDMDVDDDVEIANDLVIDNLISTLHTDDNNWYTQEAVDANWDAGYIESSSAIDTNKETPQEIGYATLTLDDMKPSINALSTNAPDCESMPMDVDHSNEPNSQPYVFLTDMDSDQTSVIEIIGDYNLNSEQTLAFRIIADHALKKSQFENQLLMGIFGEGGTGKSRLIEAIRAWFSQRNRGNKLKVTAMTGTAALRLNATPSMVNATTLHSAIGIPVENGDKSFMGKISQRKISEWKDIKDLMIDEVSMMDSKVKI